MKRLAAILCFRLLTATSFVLHGPSSVGQRSRSFHQAPKTDRILLSKHSQLALQAHSSEDRNLEDSRINRSWPNALTTGLRVLAASIAISTSCWFATTPPALAATDPKEILSCLLQKCPRPLTQCIANPKCLANVVCLNTCGDNIDCQIKCGDYFENETVGDFNKCVVSDMSCVKQKPDDGSYPIPTQTVKKFDTSFFNGRLYITAGMLRRTAAIVQQQLTYFLRPE